MLSSAKTNAREIDAPPAASEALLRISEGKISRLMDLVSELSLSVSETVASPDLAGLDLTEFDKSAHRLKLIVREIQETTSELRLVPVGDLFRRMRRMVRELERQTGKAIDLVTEGEDTEIDKLVVDRLFEPLVHIVRNSADHGLESSEDRTAAGKPVRGTITLSAAQVGGEVHIAVADDGRGLNRARILKVARERGLIGPNEEPDDATLWPVIFRPGFSTAEKVTNLSGRGVGMDVLNSVIAELRGRIAIESVFGSGTRILLAIPLTLAFLDCIVMRIGERLYANPVDSVSEIVQPGDGAVLTISAAGGGEVVKIRNELVPVCRLDSFYGEQRSPADGAQIIVVLTTSRGRIGLPVDELFDQQQVVMKPLSGHLEKIRASSGCALLGNGDVAIVLDCEKLNRSTVR